MTEVLTKISLVSSSWHGNRQQHHHRVSMVPKTCCFSYGVGRFPSWKLKSQVLRSSLFSSKFQGKNLVFGVNRAIPNRVNSQFRTSTASQLMTFRIEKAQKWWSSAAELGVCMVVKCDKVGCVDLEEVKRAGKEQYKRGCQVLNNQD